jgi:hypothetical protein
MTSPSGQASAGTEVDGVAGPEVVVTGVVEAVVLAGGGGVTVGPGSTVHAVDTRAIRHRKRTRGTPPG